MLKENSVWNRSNGGGRRLLVQQLTTEVGLVLDDGNR